MNVTDEEDIKEHMRRELTWNYAFIMLETQFDSKYAGDDASRAVKKIKALSDSNIKKQFP